MAQTFQQLMTQELQEAGLTDEQVTSALAKIYSNEKLGSKLNALVKTATEDYNAQVGRVRSLEEKDKSRDREITDWHTKVSAEYKRVNDELAALKQGAMPTFDESKYVSKDDLIAMRDNMAGSFAGALKEATFIASDHTARFGSAPDMEAIDRIATEQKLPLRIAYEKYVEPRVKEQETKAKETWEKNLRAEIERDVRSQYKLPMDARPPETSPIYARSKEKIEAVSDAELLEAYHSGSKN